MNIISLFLSSLAKEKTNIWFISSLAICLILGNVSEASAQVTPDSTLPNNSVVLPDASGNLIEITGGTRAGENLFHSFQEFSVLNGQTAFFNNGLTIENIFSRVTGASVSNIEGLIRANGTANLFLINPNGIIFGENASLNVGGSFIGSTADSIQFSDGSFYSAVNPEAPSLLTVNIPLGLQYGSESGNIIVQGIGNNTGFADPSNNDYSLIKNFRPSGLQVESENTLALIGGNIALNGGNLTAAEGHIELGSVREGLVKLNNNNNDIWTFDYQEVSGFQDIALVNAASVEVSGNSSGTVNVRGNNISLTDASAILSNTSGDGTAGSITLNGAESIKVTGVSQNEIPFVSYISTGTASGSTGAGADLTIDTNYLLIAGGAQVDTPAFGTGEGGTLDVSAERIELISGSRVAGSSGLFAPVVPGATGDGGDINIKADSLLVAEGAQVFAFSVSSATGGDINIDAGEIELNSTSPNGTPSGLFTNTFANGNGGNLTINTNTLVMKDGADLSSTVLGLGTAGNISIKAEAIALTGISNTGKLGQISTSVQEGATGFGGDISIETNSLSLSDGTQINSSILGTGKGGNVAITANEINLTGYSAAADRSSGLFATVIPGATGDSGNLSITTNNLRLADGAQIAVSTGSSGSAGNLTVTASESIELTGNAIVTGGGSSGLFSSAVFGDGDGGNVNLTTDRLVIKDGATISASNFQSSDRIPPGEGKAGSITVNANTINLDSSDLETPSSITASTFQSGGGDIILNANNAISLKNNSEITAETQGVGDGGAISLTSNSLQISDGGRLSTNTSGAGNGGEITITANTLNTIGNGTISSSSNSTTGRAGDINLSATTLKTNKGQIIATSEETGGGEINIVSDFIYLDNDSLVSTSVRDSDGGGGNVNIESNTIITNNNSDIRANAVFGAGGNINISTEVIFTSLNSDIDASSQFGLDGVVEITRLETDKQIGIVKLPDNVEDPTTLITATCPIQKNNVMVISGKGGLPDNPSSHLRGQSIWQDIRSIDSDATATKPQNSDPTKLSVNNNNSNKDLQMIVEAKSWIVNNTGNVELLNSSSRQSNRGFWYQPFTCQDISSN